MSEEFNRLPPSNPEAERSVLGCMIRDNSTIGDMAAMLCAADFYQDAHQRVFKAILEMWEKGKAVDLVLLADRLKVGNQLEDAGGYTALADLWDAAPTASNSEHYAGIVRDRSIQRQLLAASRKIAADAAEMVGDVHDLVAEAERSILAVADIGVSGNAYDMTTVMAEVYERIDNQYAMRESGTFTRGVPTGWYDLDEITCGLQDSELTIVAARPSVGKTAFGINISYHAAVNLGIPTFFCSLEQSKGELGMRLVSLHSKIDSHKLRTGKLSASDHALIAKSGGDLRKCPLIIDDLQGQDMFKIGAQARRLKARQDIKLVVIDYLQFIEPEKRKGTFNRQEEVSTISRRLKNLSRELKLPVLCLAQVNRKSEDRGDRRPKLSDLRESGAIEQDADVVTLLHRVEEEKFREDGTPIPPAPIQIIEVEVAKNRNGKTGMLLLNFRRETMRFESHEKDHG